MNFVGSIFNFFLKPIFEGLIWVFPQMLWGVVRLALDIINGIVTAFEWLAFQNWNELIFGSKSGEFAFFPTTNSPLFYAWIAMLIYAIKFCSNAKFKYTEQVKELIGCR